MKMNTEVFYGWQNMTTLSLCDDWLHPDLWTEFSCESGSWRKSYM